MEYKSVNKEEQDMHNHFSNITWSW